MTEPHHRHNNVITDLIGDLKYDMYSYHTHSNSDSDSVCRSHFFRHIKKDEGEGGLHA